MGTVVLTGSASGGLRGDEPAARELADTAGSLGACPASEAAPAWYVRRSAVAGRGGCPEDWPSVWSLDGAFG